MSSVVTQSRWAMRVHRASRHEVLCFIAEDARGRCAWSAEQAAVELLAGHPLVIGCRCCFAVCEWCGAVYVFGHLFANGHPCKVGGSACGDLCDSGAPGMNIGTFVEQAARALCR